jgi:hypothetical protein
MFQKLKKFFSKKEKKKEINYASQIINFKDLALQNIEISIQPDGNSTALVIRELKNNYKIVIDRETALLLSLILGQYYKKENITTLLDLFEKD